jgi:hypothetical protein
MKNPSNKINKRADKKKYKDISEKDKTQESNFKEASNEILNKEVSNEAPIEIDALIQELEKKRKAYWTEDTEAAIIDYLTHDFHFYNVQIEKHLEDCQKNKKPVNEQYLEKLRRASSEASSPSVINAKDKIYRDRIQKPLNKLVENIIFNFKLFRPGVDIKTTHNDCVGFVYGKFSNFNPSKNTKSFSYFGTVAKHYLQNEKKDLDKSIQINQDYDNHREEADSYETTELGQKSELETSYTLFKHVINSIEAELNKGHLSDNDMKVGDAIIEIFKNHEAIGAYNKNHIYQLIKESTGLQTKDITYSLSRFRVFYRILKQDFIKTDEEKDD